MRDGAIQGVRREAHALAGAARNVGFLRLGEAAYALQKSCEGSGHDRSAVEALEALFDETVPLADAWVRQREDAIAPT
jgi:HPt (histidine-containing phosphotransfer) domain-containing protein